MGPLPLIAALALLTGASPGDAKDSVKLGGQVAAPTHEAKSPKAHTARPASPQPSRPLAPAAPPPSRSPPSGRVAPQATSPRPIYGGGVAIPWVPIRVSQGVDELQLRGPGALSPIDDPDPVDGELVGHWRVFLPVIAAAEDGYGRVDTFRESKDLGTLRIESGGEWEWDVPGTLRSTGHLTEVTASDVSADEHFWVFESRGQRLVIAPGGNGELILYDAGSNRFFARAKPD